eukprot:12128859-Alexandrium_andersonii.AAC.1
MPWAKVSVPAVRGSECCDPGCPKGQGQRASTPCNNLQQCASSGVSCRLLPAPPPQTPTAVPEGRLFR